MIGRLYHIHLDLVTRDFSSNQKLATTTGAEAAAATTTIRVISQLSDLAPIPVEQIELVKSFTSNLALFRSFSLPLCLRAP